MKSKDNSLKEKLWKEVSRIKKGNTTTYKELAIKLKTSARAVAKMLSTNKNPIVVPCHRVIRSDGGIGGYTYRGKQDVKRKRDLLSGEGINL